MNIETCIFKSVFAYADECLKYHIYILIMDWFKFIFVAKNDYLLNQPYGDHFLPPGLEVDGSLL